MHIHEAENEHRNKHGHLPYKTKIIDYTQDIHYLYNELAAAPQKNAPSPGEIQISRNTRFFGPIPTQVHMTNSNSIGSPFLKLTVVANTQGHTDHAMYVIIGHMYALHTRYAV